MTGLIGAGLAGVLVGVAGTLWWLHRRERLTRPEALVVDLPHVLDLVRRAHGVSTVCLVTEDGPPAVAAGEAHPDPGAVERAVATARLAMGDGRNHVVSTAPEIVAVGDGHAGAAAVLASGQPAAEIVQRVTADLRRLVAGFRVRDPDGHLLRGDPRKALDAALSRLASVEGLSTALCEAARAISGRPTAVALRDEISRGAGVVAVSRVSDQRLMGSRVTVDSAAGRSITGNVPVAGLSLQELIGVVPADRRRLDDPGIAFPLHHGQQGIGALLVFGQPATLEPEIRDRLGALARELGPHLGAAQAVRAAEARARTDALTGLPNRRELERAMAQGGDRPAALLMVDLDHFKALNDGFGHAAGDAALRHVAQMFLRTLRDRDLACRVGGEEFAIWLNGAPSAKALEVAERVRSTCAETRLTWAGAEMNLTCSIGVACFPDPIRDIRSLIAAADAALYRAKQAGRNRVESAPD